MMIEQLTDLHMDPARSPALLHELPGLVAAFDESAMQAYFQQALFAQRPSDISIQRCELDQATYLLEGGAVLRYLLTIGAHANEETQEVLVSGRLFSDQRACEDYVRERLIPFVETMAARDEIALFATPVGQIEPLHMAFSAFPIDAELPTLAGATDPRQVREILRETLAYEFNQPFTIDDSCVELVDYGRRYRCTLRYRVTAQIAGTTAPQHLLVYGKLTADGSGAFAGQVSDALREQLARQSVGDQITIPRALAWLPDLQLSLLEAIPGKSLIADLLKGRLSGKSVVQGPLSLEAMVEVCARIAAAVHTSGVPLGPRRTFDDELATLRRELQPVQRFSPELGAKLQEWLEQLATTAHQAQPLRLCFNHGDFTHGQFLFDGTNSGLIDFDSICQAEPALDLGQFLTYLQLAGLKSKIAPEAASALIDDLGARFMGTYITVAHDLVDDPEQLQTRVAIYRVISLLRRVLRSWQKFKPSRIATTLVILEQEMVALSQREEAV